MNKANKSGRNRSVKSPLDRGAWGVLGGAIVVAPHLIGGIPAWATVAIAVLSLLSLLGTFFAVPERYRVLPPVYWGLILVTAWTWLQAVFLPCSWVQVVDATVVAQAREAWGLVSETSLTWCALSVDPGNTRVELLKWTAVCGFFLSGTLRVRSGERRQVLGWVGLCGVGLVLSVCGHQLTSAQTVYGFYAPRSMHVSATLGPLLNENNLGGFLVLLAGAQIGLASVSRSSLKRVAWGLAASASLATAVFAGSRGAAGAACLLCALVALRPWLASKSQVDFRGNWGRWVRRGLLPVAGMVGLLSVVGWQLLEDPQIHDLSKLELWATSWPVVMQRPILGIGRGAFSAAFTPVWGGLVRFTYIENLPLQWMAEWGVPLGTVLFVLVLNRIWTGVRRPRSTLRYLSAAGAAAFLAQNLVDFSAELLGVAAVTGVLLAAIARSRREARFQRWGFRPEAMLVVMLLTLVVYGYSVLQDGTEILADRLKSADLAEEGAAFKKELARGAKLHAQEALMPYLAAARAVRLADSNAAAFINRSMVLAPGWVGPHVLAARMLWQMGRKGQAADELRGALAANPSIARRAACALAKQDPEYVRRMLPLGEFRKRSVESIAFCLPMNHPSRGLLNRILMAEIPDEQAAFLRETHRLLSTNHRDMASALLETEISKSSCKTKLVRRLSRLKSDSRDPEGGLALVAEAADRCGLDRELLSAKAIALAGLGRAGLAHAALGRVRGMGSGDRRKASDALFTLAAVELALGEPRKALEAYRKLAFLYGNLDGIWNAANLAERLGELDQAERWWRKGCQRAPEYRGMCKRLSQLAGVRAKSVRDGVNRR